MMGMLLRARFVAPVEGPVIENGALAVRRGRIEAVGPAGDLRGADVVDFGDSVIVPGFVNAHTHLELTHLAGQVPPEGHLTDWLLRLMTALVDAPPTRQQIEEAVIAGIRASIRAGVTCVGDISRNPGWTRPVLAQSALYGISFGEVAAVGTRRYVLDERLAAATDVGDATDRLRIGVSPHSPYTVEPDALRTCAERAEELALPVCIHLAETSEEEAFTLGCRGPLAEYLQRMGVWDDAIACHGARPFEAARSAGLLGPRTILAHGNYIDEKDYPSLASSGTSVAYCPRTHHAFRHAPHPFRRMLRAGVNVCIGTDSLASNPSLSILDELQFLRRACPDLEPELLLAMGTLSGARALGFDHQSGSLKPGKHADLAVIPLPDSSNAWSGIFDTACAPLATYLNGVEVDTQD